MCCPSWQVLARPERKRLLSQELAVITRLPETIMTVFFFLFGLVWGSFGNVLIWRLPRGEGISRPSHCTACGHTLAPLDLVPLLSWVVLGGRCRYCRAPISARYPAAEALTGLLFVLVYRQVGVSPAALAVYVAYVTVTVIVLFTDFVRALIPNSVIVPGLAVALLAAALRLDPFGPALGQALLGGVCGAAVFLAFYVLSRGGGMGMGDVKLAAFMGLALGPLKLLLAVMVGSVLAVLAAALVMLFAGKRLRSLQSVEINAEQEEEPEATERVFGMMLINGRPAVPFGTFLVVGFAAALFWGDAVIRWWLGV
jgi:leader peptidase (prepilin peptidase)/N-methyltransferase